jgi:hypothetical protein
MYENGAIILNGTYTTNFIVGRLVICVGMEWRTVCSDFWGEDDARVACRQLGFTSKYNKHSNYYMHSISCVQILVGPPLFPRVIF